MESGIRLNNSPLVPEHTRNKGGIIHNFPNPKIFRLRRAYETGFREIDGALGVCSPPQAEIFDILRFAMQFTKEIDVFSLKTSIFRLRRKVSDKLQNLRETRGELFIRGELFKRIPLMVPLGRIIFSWTSGHFGFVLQ